MIEALIHGIHALGRLHAAKFLTPPRHEISISPRLALAFDQKSRQMIQQYSGDEIIVPNEAYPIELGRAHFGRRLLYP